MIISTKTDPITTLGAIRAWISQHEYDAIGVATFGPVDARKASPKYGFITATPKPGWGDTDVLGLLGLRPSEESRPVLFDTDVNAPALAEYTQLKKTSVGKDMTSCAYITVGTGVGVGLVVNGSTVHGLMHPEAGHIQVPRMAGDDFPGNCPFHSSCIEGMCGSKAVAERVKIHASQLGELSDDDAVWDVVAYQLAHLCSNLVMIASPEKIIIGGGLLNRTCLYGLIRTHVLRILNGYITSDQITPEGMEAFIAPSAFGNNAGIVGAVFLAQIALSTAK
jgi:fructokinase